MNMYRQKQALFLFDMLLIEEVKAQYDKRKTVYEFTFDSSTLEDFFEKLATAKKSY